MYGRHFVVVVLCVRIVVVVVVRQTKAANAQAMQNTVPSVEKEHSKEITPPSQSSLTSLEDILRTRAHALPLASSRLSSTISNRRRPQIRRRERSHAFVTS